MNSISTQAWPKHLAFWLSFITLGIPYWLLPYESLTLPNGLFNIGAIVLLLASMALKGICKSATQDALLITAAAAPAVVIVRILLEVFMVADSHNLWPFELIIACLFGLLVAGLGTVVGALIARIR